MLGLPALPLVPIPHPLAGNEPELVQAKAAAVVDELLFALCAPAAALEARHAARFRVLTEKRLAGGAVCVDEVCALDSALAAPAAHAEGAA